MKVSNQLDEMGFTKFGPVSVRVREDHNKIVFTDLSKLKDDLKRRARAVLGLRGVNRAEKFPLDANALQHGVRMLTNFDTRETGASEPRYAMLEMDVAAYAVYIANESLYWN